MPLALPLPDGRFVTIREGETPEQTWARAQQMYPDAFATKQTPEAPKAGSRLGDIATAFQQGAVGSTKALTDVFGAQNAASASLGATSEALQKNYSAARQAELQAQAARMKEAEASGSTWEEIKAGAKNIAEAPVQAVAQGLGSLVPYIPTMFLGPLAGALRLARPTVAALESISSAAPKVLGTAQGLGTVKGAVYDAVLQKETEAGVPLEVAKQKAEAAQDYFGKNADQILLGGGLGYLAGSSGVERLLTKKGAAEASQGLARRIGTAAGEEFITEGPQGGQERLASNIAQQRAGYDVPTMQGVIGAGLQEGLTGALTAGPVAALRGPQTKLTKAKEQTDIEQARAEEEARLQKEREYKASPAYLQDVVTQYEDLAQQKKDLVSQKKKIEKGSLTEDADKAFNKDIETQLRDLQKQIIPLAKDYYQAKSYVTQQAKQAELAGMTPQEYMLQQMGVKPSATKEEPENDYVALATQNKPLKAPPSAAQQYMQGQFQAAQGLVNDPAGYADYMMQDPKMAAEIVQNRLKVPGLTATDNNLLLSGIALRLKEQEKAAQRAAKQELGQRQADLQAQKLTTPEDQMALFTQSTEDVEKLRAEGETNFDYLDPMFETALAGKPSVVQVSDTIKPTDRAPLIRQQVESLMETADQADKDYQTARSANQPDAARKAYERGNQAIEQINTISKEGGDYAREFLSARRAQNNAMAQLGDITEQLRTGQTLGGTNKEMAASTEQSLTNKANQVRAQLVAATLQEAAIHRRAAGNPALTYDEAIKAASVVHDAVNDWVERSKVKNTQPTYEDVVVQPAQMRADKIVRPAVTERRQVAPGTQAISPAEAKHFQARVLAARNQLIAPPQGLGRRIETGILKRQFSAEEAAKTAEARGETATTLAGELRRRMEYVRNKMAKMGAMRPAARDVLNAAADVMDAGKATRDILDTVEPVVDAIVSGRDVKQVDIRAIKDALAATKPTAVEQKAAGQAALFPETNEEFGYIRATAANFAKSPRMKPVWEALDKARALFKKSEAARAQRSATVRARMRELENLQSRIENITKGAEFIAARQEKWSSTELVNAFASKKSESSLSPTAFIDYRNAAIRTINEGRRLDDLDNRLLGFMQDTNKEISDAAKVMYEKVAPLRDAVAAIKKAMKTSPTVTAEEKALLAHEDEIKKQRGEYQRATENAIKKAREDMDAARAALLDPQIKAVSTALAEAEATLAKENKALEKAKADFEGPVEGSPQDKNQIKTYFLFKVEEKQGVIDDLTKQIEKQKDDLESLVAQRYEEMDGAAAVAQAMLDKNVKTERTWLEMLEAQLAFVRGDDVLKKANSYPFAAERARISAKNQVQVVKAAEKRAEEFKAAAKTQQQEMEEFWQDKLGGEGIKVARKKISGEQLKSYEKIETDIAKQKEKIASIEAALEGTLTKRDRKAKETTLNKANEALTALQKEEREFSTRFYEVSKTLTKEEKEAKRLQEAGIQSAMRLDKIERSDLVKEAQTKLLADQIADRLVQLEGIPGSNDIDELKKVLDSDKSTEKEIINAQVRIGLLQEIKALEAQEEVLSEGKPRKKQRPATTLSSTAQAKGKPLRTGFLKDLDNASAAVRAEKEKGTYGEERFTGGDLEGANLFFGGEERFFSRGKPAEGQTVASLKEELRKAMGGNVTSRGNVEIYSNVEDYIQRQKPELQDALRQQIPPDAKGFAQGDKAVLFAENIGKGHGLGVLLHEIGVHVGFRNFFNEGQYKALVNQVKQWAQRTDGSIEEKVGKAAQRRVEMANTDESQVDDELLAYAVEEAVQMGVNPQGVKGGSALRNWLNMVVAAFKKALNAFGINPTNLQAGDLVNFAYGCAQLELKGTWHGTDATFNKFDLRKAGTGEGAFDRRFDADNSLGAGPYTTPDKEYGEYYQHAIPFGKAAKETGYGNKTYEDYRSMDEKFMTKNNADLSVAELQNKYESVLLSKYLTSVSAGGDLDPTKNAAVQKALQNFQKMTDPRVVKAIATLSADKIKGFTKRPAKGNLYRTLDDIPLEKVFNINSTATLGERPEIDALREKYGKTFIAEKDGTKVDIGLKDGKYTLNSLFYKMRRDLGIDKTIALLKDAGIEALEQKNDRKYIERAYIDNAPEILAVNLNPVGTDKDVIFLSRKAKYNNPEFEDASKVTSRIVAQNRSWWDKIKANATGLAVETQLVDRYAGFERLKKYLPELRGTQMLFYLRQYDQRMNLVSQSVGNGAPTLVEKQRKDGQIERMVESKEGASLSGVVNTLKDAKQYIGNGEAVNQMFTTYLAALRADNKGIDSLNFGKDKNGNPIVTQADLDKVKKLVDGNKDLKAVFNKARSEYNEYNRNLIKFLVDTGALDQATANRLVREDDYIPFYRERNGVAQLLIGSESPIYIGSIKEQPYLQELVGGDQPILDFMTSSVQNTNLLVDMGMRNLATKNAVMELVNLKAATLVKKTSGTDVVKFKIDGGERYAILHTEKVKIGNKEFETGVPADILIKGMEGIPTQMPFLLRAMAVPSQLLRKGIVLSPLYQGKQLFRDSLAAPIISGADFLPVIGALKELRGTAKRDLEKRGIVGGQQFKGTSEDLSKILRDIADDKPGWMQALGKLESAGMEADALTRRAQYNSYIEQGLSEMEATLMALESMNFNKRGASPSIHVANALIPFFNAQIQGLNVMYKAMTGKMPFNDKLRIREKMLQRAALMAGITLAYAVGMEDDEAYKNATPDQKYGNWFVRVPGVDEPVRLPVPFEIGYLFKALPEALYNSMTTEHGGEEAVKAFKQILLQTVPGGSSYGIPQFFKPAIEVGLGKSFYTGRDLLSAQEQRKLPEEQYRNNTTEAAKYVGSSLGISPIKIEALINGYTGTLGLAFMQAISLGVPVGESPEKAVKRLSEYPVVGGVFQPNDAGGIINSVYERMNEAEQVRTTVRSLMQEGKVAEANALLERRGNEYMQAEISDVFKSNMNKLTQAERAINASNMSPQEKRKQLDEIRKMKIGLANAVREISDKTIHLSGFS